MARRQIAGMRTIVTGASSGIGRELARQLVAKRARVVAMARREERLRELENEFHQPNHFIWVAGDVTNREDRQRAIAACAEKFGGLDALVNNAGIGALGPFVAADAERLREVFEVNFFAPINFIRESLPQLHEGRQPIVVNVGSVLGHRAVPDKSEYCASKFALHGMTDALRLELGQDGIDTLLVSPSTTDSEFFDRAIGEPAGDWSRFGKMSPETVARKIIQAMAAGRREIILSSGGKLLVWIDRLCPPMADWFVGRTRP